MTEKLLVHDTIRITVKAATEKALALGCPIIHHELNTWMKEQGVFIGADGFVAVVLCSIPAHNAAREILGVFRGAQLTKANLDAVQDCPPDPPTEEEQSKSRLRELLEGGLGPGEIKETLERLVRLVLR